MANGLVCQNLTEEKLGAVLPGVGKELGGGIVFDNIPLVKEGDPIGSLLRGVIHTVLPVMLPGKAYDLFWDAWARYSPFLFRY